MQVYSKVSATNNKIKLGEQAIIEGTPKSLFLIEEEGRINLRGRYMGSNTRGRIYDGVYRPASAKDLQTFSYKKIIYEEIYRRSLYSVSYTHLLRFLVFVVDSVATITA